MGVLALGLHTTRSTGICVNVHAEWASDSCCDLDGSISPSISLQIQKTRSRALIYRQPRSGTRETVPNKTGGKFSCSKARACVEMERQYGDTATFTQERGKSPMLLSTLTDSTAVNV